MEYQFYLLGKKTNQMKIIRLIKENKWLLLILALASFLRLYRADFQSIWVDEILTMNNANLKLSLKEFYNGVLFWEYIPHLYFLLVRILFEIFGYSTLVARIFSGVIGIVGVYSVYLLGKEMFDKKAGLISAAILSVNIFHISYSQEIRPYGMLFLFTVLAFYRLIILIKKPSLNNAVFYGIFAGLILHSHFFGFITLFAQYLILLFFLLISEKEDRKKFFFYSFTSGIVTLIVFSPVYEAFVRVSGIESFWLQRPGSDAITKLFNEFFGFSELVLFIVNFLIIYYVISVFKEREQKLNFYNLISNKLIFSFIIIITWLSVSIIIPLLRSHLDVPMILSRYFINILPAIILTIAAGLFFIKNSFIKKTVLIFLIIFSLVDLFAITKYYHSIRKTQFRELTSKIIEKNPNNDKIVAYWSWLLPHFFNNSTQIEEKTLEKYVTGLMNNTIDEKPFWYFDANSRPFSLTFEQQNYLNDNYSLKEKLEYFDAWAHYYVPKNYYLKSGSNELDLSIFKSSTINENGHIMMFENSYTFSTFFSLKKGKYKLILNGNSLPEDPINGENAHLKVKINGNMIGDFYLSENKSKIENELIFECDVDKDIRIQLIYDNDISVNTVDRNLIIYSIKILEQ
mgnify:CR=1 FL=1